MVVRTRRFLSISQPTGTQARDAEKRETPETAREPKETRKPEPVTGQLLLHLVKGAHKMGAYAPMGLSNGY